MPPADRGRRAPSPPGRVLKRNTTHVVIRELKTGTLGFLGHSAIDYSVALAERARARQLALFHHDPWRTDAEIDALVAQHATASIRVFAAYDGMTVDLP